MGYLSIFLLCCSWRNLLSKHKGISHAHLFLPQPSHTQLTISKCKAFVRLKVDDKFKFLSNFLLPFKFLIATNSSKLFIIVPYFILLHDLGASFKQKTAPNKISFFISSQNLEGHTWQLTFRQGFWNFGLLLFACLFVLLEQSSCVLAKHGVKENLN